MFKSIPRVGLDDSIRFLRLVSRIGLTVSLFIYIIKKTNANKLSIIVGKYYLLNIIIISIIENTLL